MNRVAPLTISAQCNLAGISRSTFYYQSVIKENSEDLRQLVLGINEKRPFYGYRRIYLELNRLGFETTEYRVRQVLAELGICAIYPKPNLSKKNKEHKIYPYLLRGLDINRINQVWATDITYIKFDKSFIYLSAVIDLYSRKILSWNISNTYETEFCIETLENALVKYGDPEIFNTDQGSQYTSNKFTATLLGREIAISMDGRGRALDNIFIERFWRTIKYEEIYLNEYKDVKALKSAIATYIDFYNNERFHSSLANKTPSEFYEKELTKKITNVG